MPHGVAPRYGSMQFWHRRRAKKLHASIRAWHGLQASALGFTGYKVGMTHLLATDNRQTADTKGEDIFLAATIVECPPLKVASARFYKNSAYGSQPISQINSENLDKELSRRIALPKKQGKKFEDISGYDNLTLIVYTQPKLTSIGKKAPEIFEIALGGKLEDKAKYAKEKLGKEITINEVFKEGEQLDVHSITKGKGFQGPVKRFGIGRTSHKSEKHTRNPGSLGGWSAQGHVMYRVAHAGQMGYHQRTEYNKQLLKIGTDAKEVMQRGGFVRYGQIKNQYALIRGSIGGAKKRLITFTHAVRPNRSIPKDAPKISYISIESKQ
jgi:large subunit ribosomal protein L3